MQDWVFRLGFRSLLALLKGIKKTRQNVAQKLFADKKNVQKKKLDKIKICSSKSQKRLPKIYSKSGLIKIRQFYIQLVYRPNFSVLAIWAVLAVREKNWIWVFLRVVFSTFWGQFFFFNLFITFYRDALKIYGAEKLFTFL